MRNRGGLDPRTEDACGALRWRDEESYAGL